MIPLQLLEPMGRSRITPAFLEGQGQIDVRDCLAPFRQREIDLVPLTSLVDTAMRTMTPTDSDAWLAPRLHAALRLHRRDAADARLWDYLAVVEFPDYVRWRWPGGTGSGTPRDRFVGSQYKQAFSLLWWMAELTRNGLDYSATATAFRMQDIPNTWLRLDAFHHRPAALAAVRFLASCNGGGLATSSQVNQLSRAFNVLLTTVVLDAVTPNPPPDPIAMDDWIKEPVDETLWKTHLPKGPDEAAVPEESVGAVEDILRRLAADIKLVGATKTAVVA